MKVDWQTYYDAAAKCRGLADELRSADKPLHQVMKGECAGMAGDAPGCREWGGAYDRAARQTLQANASLANALTNYGAVLYAMGHHYGIANKSNPPQPDVSQVGDYTVSLPTSVADNGLGFTEHSPGTTPSPTPRGGSRRSPRSSTRWTRAPTGNSSRTTSPP
ncbi:hypothetical protein AB0H71_12435 [Nocardia sp. NPDC050697]|uniref:hypothetical protein n=1 Tax=Nocardia sp. NPDC050697 TaxID=3155158 RepID=UPI00340CB349